MFNYLGMFIFIVLYFFFSQIPSDPYKGIHIPQDIENVTFHYKMFHLLRNKSMDTEYTYKHTYIQIHEGSVDTNT
jgi:hypothetical protein